MSKIIATGAGWNELFEEARDALQRRALDDAECALSLALDRIDGCKDDDPRLAATLNLLARVNAQQGRFDAAVALLERLLNVQETSLGPRHPQLAGVLSNLAEMYAHTASLAQELSMRKRVYDIRSAQAGSDPAILARLGTRIAELRAKLVAATGSTPAITTKEPPAFPTLTPAFRPFATSASSSSITSASAELSDRYSGLDVEPSESITPESSTPVTLWHRSPSQIFTPLAAAPIRLPPPPKSRLSDWRIRVAGAGALAATILLTVMASRGSSSDTGKADSLATLAPKPPAVAPTPTIFSATPVTTAPAAAGVREPDNAGDGRDATRRGSTGDVAREESAARAAAAERNTTRAPSKPDTHAAAPGGAATPAVDVDRMSRSLEDALKRIDASSRAVVDSLNKTPAVAPSEFRKVKLSEPRRP